MLTILALIMGGGGQHGRSSILFLTHDICIILAFFSSRNATEFMKLYEVHEIVGAYEVLGN